MHWYGFMRRILLEYNTEGERHYSDGTDNILLSTIDCI